MFTSLITFGALAAVAVAGPLQGRSSFAPGPFNQCSQSDLSQLSCHNTTAIKDSCCFEGPGGILLQTQFWDTNPVTGPSDSWTIHGLWPDNCDGSYQQFCAPEREVTGDNITSILEHYGEHNLLRYMRRYWKNQTGDDSALWAHEFNKHGTCMSTFNPECYADNVKDPRKDVADFFTKTVEVYKTLDTYNILKKAGIKPSATQNYTLAAIQSALTKATGHTAYVGCTASGALDEMWYMFNVYGRVQDGKYVGIDSVSKSSCPATNIAYLPKPKAPGKCKPTKA